MTCRYRPILLVLLLTAFAAPAGAQTVRYVDASATGTNDGISWTDAYVHLQDALDEAELNETTDYEIYVAEGTYYPDEDSVDNDGNGQNEHTDDNSFERFVIEHDNVVLYGGYPAGGGIRDPTTHETVLSGDIAQDDAPFAPNTDSDGQSLTPSQTDHIVGTNSQVLFMNGFFPSDVTSATVIDGFTIASGEGMWDSSGGGLACRATFPNESHVCNPTITNVTFEGNRGTNGGALYCDAGPEFGGSGNCNPTLTNATFNGNSASSGGAIYNLAWAASSEASPVITGAVFSNNYADRGGAIYNKVNSGTSNPPITGSTFTGNTAGQSGGAIYNDASSGGMAAPTITDTGFSGNSADGSGGGGGAIYNHAASPPLTNVTFADNNTAGDGGAVYNNGAGNTITNAVFFGNSANGFGGALANDGRSGPSSPAITDTDFVGNTAGQSGGGIYNNGSGNGSSPGFTNVRFLGNTAEGFGGGAVYNFCQSTVAGAASPQFTNVLFSGNASTFDGFGSGGGGAIFQQVEDRCTSSTVITNATFAGNTANRNGGALYNDGSLVKTANGGMLSPTIANSIFFGNIADADGTGNGVGAQIASEGHVVNNDGVTVTVGYTLTEGGLAGISEADGAITVDDGGILDADPRFADADGPDGTPGTLDDDLRLRGNISPAIDAGNNDAMPAGVTTDLGGHPRFVDVPGIANTGNGSAPIVDMGAYESDGAALPVELVAFDAVFDAATVALAWQTATETNNAGFEIQRSVKDEDAWQALGFVEGAGTTTEPQAYRFADANLPFAAGTLVYRLRQVNLDGTAALSPSVEVVVNRTDKLTFYPPFPNPSTEHLTLRYELPQTTHVRLVLYNVLGQHVATLVEATEPAGRQEVRVNLHRFAPGLYIAALNTDDARVVRRIVVVK